jgi:hypothetical protein
VNKNRNICMLSDSEAAIEKGKVKLSLQQAVEALRVVRRQGSHIF